MNEPLLHTTACLFIKGMGPVKFKTLLEKDGLEGVAAFAATHPEALKTASAEIRKASDAGVSLVPIWSEGYPSLLREIHDPPILLFVKGALPQGPAVGVVGSRVPSIYGLTAAAKISAELSASGVTIVSGMARGIDTSAHQGALSGGGKTVAVLGGGLARLYPPENTRLAEKIAKSGALVSEYPMETEIRGEYFPRRNRIISGLSRSVIVVEAKEKSGALITADQALEQGRDVYAVPGNIDSARSRGTNSLIKQGARPFTDSDEVLADLAMAQAVKKTAPAGLGAEETSLLNLIAAGTPVHADELIEKSGLATGRALSCLSTLAIKGLARELPGKYYVSV